jgi:hypothetical protein
MSTKAVYKKQQPGFVLYSLAFQILPTKYKDTLNIFDVEATEFERRKRSVELCVFSLSNHSESIE